MRKLLCILACALADSRAPAGHYQNFGVAVYITVDTVNTFSDPEVLRSQWEAISSQVKVDKVYIEVQRTRVLASDQLLEQVKEFFIERGVQVAAGTAYSDRNATGQFQSFCYTSDADRDFVRRVAQLAARHFDEFILDDFFFVTTKFDSDIAAKGPRSWTDFRLALMDEAGANLVLKAAKDVNPRIKVVIKFPNWYEHFQGLGFDLDKEPRMFDGIYTGTETRDPVTTDQFLQQYESYQIIRYFENIKPGGNGGGWVDTYNVRYVDRYAEQLWDTMFAKAREITLFNWRDILEAADPGRREAWQGRPVSLDYDAIAGSYHAAPGGPATPTWAAVAGASLRQADQLLGKLGNPVGIACYKPYQSSGEDFLHNYIGMIGIPIDLRPQFPKDARLILLTESARFDPDIVAKIKGQLEGGKSVVITSGLLRALKGRGIEDVCEAQVTENKVLATGYSTGYGSGARAELGLGEQRPPVLFPEVHFLTNDAWGLVSAIENGNGYPLMLMDRYAKGALYVWTIPDNFRNLYALPADVTARFRDVIMRDFFVRIDGPGQVALFAYDNATFVAQSFLPTQCEVTVTTDGEHTKLRNLATGEVIASCAPEAAKVTGRRHDWPAPPRRSHFKVTLPPHSYAAFAIEK
jgi:hypothetical protein